MDYVSRIFYDDLRGSKVVDKNDLEIGKIIDVVINKDLTLSSFILGGSFIEEKLEELGLKPDDDPIVPINKIDNIRAPLKVTAGKEELASTLDTNAIGDDELRLSDLQKMQIRDSNNEVVGEIANFFITADNQVEYIIGGDILHPYLKTMQSHSKMNYCSPGSDLTFNGDHLILNQTLDDMEFKIKRDFRYAFLDAFDEAHKDGKVTDDEWALLNKLSEEFDIYKEALKTAAIDGIITKEEEAQLERHREEIIHQMVMVANQDEVINQEERAIIEKLSSYLIHNKAIKFWQVFGSHKN